eukprot:scaffold11638_cov74-Skeletonema_dohrnii-CCMP3373.AAC.2
MSSWWSSAKTEVLGAALGRVLFRHGQKAFNSTSHRYVISGLASHASSMCLRKAPAAGGSHGSGTGEELRCLE